MHRGATQDLSGVLGLACDGESARAQVASLQFNVLVTTYEYIMRDRARLAKVLLREKAGCIILWHVSSCVIDEDCNQHFLCIGSVWAASTAAGHLTDGIMGKQVRLQGNRHSRAQSVACEP